MGIILLRTQRMEFGQATQRIKWVRRGPWCPVTRLDSTCQRKSSCIFALYQSFTSSIPDSKDFKGPFCILNRALSIPDSNRFKGVVGFWTWSGSKTYRNHPKSSSSHDETAVATPLRIQPQNQSSRLTTGDLTKSTWIYDKNSRIIMYPSCIHHG